MNHRKSHKPGPVTDGVNVSPQESREIVEPVGGGLAASRIHGNCDLEALLSGMPADYWPAELDWGPPTGKEVW